MADIFREIDEELRADRAAAFWKRYGSYVVGFAVLLVVAAGVYAFLQQRAEQARAAESVRFAQALNLAERGDIAGASSALQGLAQDTDSGYRTLARLTEAGLAGNKGEVDKALALYDQVAADTGTDKLYRDLAVLLAGYHRVDREDLATFKARMDPIAGDASPWRFSARELIGLAQLRAGDKAAAKASFTRLADDALAPSGVRARAAELLASLAG